MLSIMQSWYQDLQTIHSLLSDTVNQCFLLRYDPANRLRSDTQFYQRLSCILTYHFPSSRRLIAKGDLTLMFLNKFFYTATSSATLTGVLTACFRPQLFTGPLQKLPSVGSHTLMSIRKQQYSAIPKLEWSWGQVSVLTKICFRFRGFSLWDASAPIFWDRSSKIRTDWGW